jgi:hypothetical protein
MGGWCTRDGDSAGCAPFTVAAGATFSPRWHLGSRYALGAVAALGALPPGPEQASSNGGGVRRRTLSARLGAEGRIFTLDRSSWMAFETGCAAARERRAPFGGFPAPAGRSSPLQSPTTKAIVRSS